MVKIFIETILSDTAGAYLKWVHLSYDTLIFLLKAVGREHESNQYAAKLSDWLEKTNAEPESVTIETLHASPEPYEEFLKKFNLWGNKVSRIKSKLFKKNGKLNLFKKVENSEEN